MKIAYLHGLESTINKNDPKIIFMNTSFDEVYAPSINYKDSSQFNKLLSDIKKMKPDFIVGSSMGGYVSYLIGSKLSIPTILFNPAMVGRSFDPVVDSTGLKGSMHTVYFGKNDKVIDSDAVKKYFDHEGAGRFTYNIYAGGHRVPADVFINAIKLAAGISENKIIKSINTNMKYVKLFEEFIFEAETPEWHDSDAPDANGKFKELGIKDLAAWLIKTRNKDLKKITGSLNQQIVFNRNEDPEYADKMDKVRIEVYKQLGREDLLEAAKKPGPDAYMTNLDDETEDEKREQMKKQAEMDDDDDSAYKEMPGDKEAQEKGKVKTSKHTKSYHELYGDEVDEAEKKQSTDRSPIDSEAIETGLKKKADETGVPIGIIRAVMRRGMAAWKTGHRPGATEQQWGYARVNSFLTKQDGTWGGADKDLAKEVRDGGHDKNMKS